MTDCQVSGSVVGVELVDATREGKADERGDQQEPQDVADHTSQSQLERSEVGTDCEELDQFEETEDVGRGEQGFTDERWVELMPVDSVGQSVRVVVFLLEINLNGQSRPSPSRLSHVNHCPHAYP